MSLFMLAGTPEAYPHLRLFKRRIEGPAAGCEILLLHEAAGLAGAELAVHAAVFPFHGEWPLIADAIQLADDLFEVDGAATGAAEIPAAAMVAEVQMAGQDARATVERDDRVLDV